MSLRPLLALVLATSALGQVTISNLATGYTQSFDSLVSSGTGTWADNTTLTGWYARTTLTASITSYGVNTGSNSSTAGLYSTGTALASDRALGFVSTNAFTGSSGSGQNFLGLRLTNSSGADAISFTLSYDGEEWRRENTASVQSLTVQYSLNATSVNDTGATWTTISALTFNSPIVGATTAASLDGNALANRLSLSATTTASWLQNANLWIRWIDLNDSGVDHVLAVDNVSLTATAAAIPEPSTYAAIFGALVLTGVALRRRLKL